ncbi:unnamed protein product [Schistosoma curassoni]|uniref:Uncharacterized protein n=1 Tax=Schistosoma curassoni TaxID=6186 RepID=A0A183L3E7_9TREM|nr:unnamed protein product [Schistosoma curassoni]
MICQDIRHSTNSLGRLSPMRNQGHSDNNSLRSCEAGQEDEYKFGQCLSCSKFHLCTFRNSKFFKCGEIGLIQSVCNTKVHSAATNVKISKCDPIKFGVYNDYFYLSMTLESGQGCRGRC